MPSPRVSIAALALAASGFAACHGTHAAHAAEKTRTVSPTIDVEVEDVAPGAPRHVARFSLSVSDGHGEITTRDGDASYDVKASSDRDAPGKLALRLTRSEHGPLPSDLDVRAAIPEAPGGPILVAHLDRPNGRSTTILARTR